MHESGMMIRSTDEWEMSRSCQSAHIFQRRHGIAADDAREAAELFAGDRVALVRHRRAAFLPCGKIFLHLQHLRPLQMPELRRPAIDARRDDREHRLKFRVPVALDDLRAKRRRGQSEPLANRAPPPADRDARACRLRR